MPGGILPPLSVVFNWPNPNYVNPQTRGWGIIVVSILLPTLSSTVVCARLFARTRLRVLGIDDAIIVVAMIPAIAMSVLICLAQRKFGFDHHVWDNPVPRAVNSRKIVMALEATYIAATGLTKISILLFYRRLVSGSVSKTFVWAIRASVFFVAAYIILFENTLIFGCEPINAYWNQVDPVWRTSGKHPYSCLNEVGALYAANITSIVQDFLTFLMPLILFAKLQLPLRQKVLLGVVFGIGFFLCIVGIVRILYTRILYYDTYDVTWESFPLWIWTGVELHGAVMCASAPALKLFFDRYLKPASSTQSSSFGRSRGSNFDEAKMLRDAENGSFALVSQRSETQSGTSTYKGGRTIAESMDGPFYSEKTEIEEWNGNIYTARCGPATPCPAHFRAQQWSQTNKTVYNLTSCSWYDD